MKAHEARIREIVTPEGVALPFEVASAGDRFAAFALDFFIVHIAVVALVLLGALLSQSGFGAYAGSIALLSSFLLRNFYFTFFEVRWGGSTIGKRKLGLRVISRDGGPLRAESVFARNLTRDMEVFLPITAVVAPQSLLPGLPIWAALVGCVWLLLFGLLPLFSKDRLRIGDLLAGTLVVNMPKARLQEDLAELPAGAYAGAALGQQLTDYTFAPPQLDLYGIKELQLLEELLRKSKGYGEMKLLEAVETNVKAKIGWPEDVETDTWHFLTAFYKAQRSRLEHKMLFGVRQEEKRQGRLEEPPVQGGVQEDADD